MTTNHAEQAAAAGTGDGRSGELVRRDAAIADAGLSAGAISAELGPAAREVLPAPLPGQRYHPRGLTELWARRLADKAATKGRRPHTARAYTRAVARWLRYCLLQGVDPLAARRADVDDWLSQQRIGAQTIRQRLAALSNWYGYLLDNDIDTRDPARLVERPERETDITGSPDIVWLDAEQLAALLAASQARAEAASTARAEVAARDDAALWVLGVTGLRSGAVRDAQLRDFFERGGHWLLRYRTKRGTWGERPLAAPAVAALHRYLDLRATREGVPRDELCTNAPLLATTPYRGRPGRRPLSEHHLIDLVRTVAAEAELDVQGLVAHSIRHSVGTALVDKLPLREVQVLLDHQDPRNTAIYTHVGRDHAASPVYTMARLLAQASTHPRTRDEDLSR